MPLVSIALISATTLAYEVLLTRLFSIAQWHHFAHMAISIALLGFGASGTFLALAPRLVERYTLAYIGNIALFALLAVPCFLVAQRFAVNPEQLLWEPMRMFSVSAVYLALGLPFFVAANALGLSLMRYRAAETVVYGADLIGAGVGGIAIVALLYLLFPIDALLALALLGALAAIIGAVELRAGPTALTASALASAVLVVLSVPRPELAMSPYKALAQQLAVIGADVELERTGPLGQISVVANPEVPLRHAPGLSLEADEEIPEQRGIFVDGDGPLPIDAGGDTLAPGYLDALPSALPYHLARPERVVVLGADGGRLVRRAIAHGASRVTVVETNRQLVELLRDGYREFTGGLYARDEVETVIADARGFFAAGTRRFELIELEPLGSFATSAAGVLALSAGYLFTVEAFGDYLAALEDGGLLAVTHWIKLPPRDLPKLVATAVAALERAGVADPAARLLLIRGWQTATLLVKRGSFTLAEIDAARRFADERAFDLVFHRDMPESLANRHNVLPEPLHHRAARALLGDGAERFIESYKFDIRPATDDRPFFSHFFRWRTLPEILSLVRQGGVPLLESGYLLLVATLVQALLLSALLIALPLAARRRTATEGGWSMFWYFSALGIAFLFVEIVFIQKVALFVHHPVLAFATTLGGFLVFAGVGSALAGRWRRRYGERTIVLGATSAIAALGLLYAFALPVLVFEPLAAATLAAKVAVTVALIAPLAIAMGMPFPLGLARLGERAPALVPLAWAINGCASVISAVLAVLLAIHLGFSAVLLIAFALYLSAALVFDR